MGGIMLEKLIEKFGKDNQKMKAIEELSELMKEIAKDNRAGIVEEMIDVYIMLEQIALIYNITDDEQMKMQQVKFDRIRKLLGGRDEN